MYPTVFLLIASVRSRWSVHSKLFVGLVVIIAGSFALSVFQTASSPTVAYFSPLTRAWELAIGALVAVSTKWLLTLPKTVCAILTWVGLAGIAFGAVVFNGNTAYPGSLVAIPVVGAALVIAGGTRTPPWAAESVLKGGPFQWFGKLSYSIYLWHWPLLIIAADVAGASLPFRRNIIWLVVALAASVASFYWSRTRCAMPAFALRRWTPIGFGAVLIAVSLIVATVEIDVHAAPPASSSSSHETTGAVSRVASSTAEVERLVRASANIEKLPADLTPALTDVRSDWGGRSPPCWPAVGQSSIPACMFGDLNSKHTMVVYGDSHAGMWFDTLQLIATAIHWRLAYLGKGYCPANFLAYGNPPGFERPGGEYSVCNQWHGFAITGSTGCSPPRDHHPGGPPQARWQPLQQRPMANKAEESAASETGTHYVSVTPWFCSSTCVAVIGNFEVYWDDFHRSVSRPPTPNSLQEYSQARSPCPSQVNCSRRFRQLPA